MVTYTLVTVVGFTLVGVLVYYALRVYLEDQSAELLASQARAAVAPSRVSGDLGVRPHAPLIAGSATAIYSRQGTHVVLEGADAATRWVPPPFDAYPDLLDRYLLVGPLNHGVLVSDVPPPIRQLILLVGGEPLDQKVAFMLLDGPDGPVMLTAYPLSQTDVLLVETPLATVDQQLRADMVVYALSAGAALLVVVALAHRLTSRALAPLEQVARVADQISAGAAGRRTGLRGEDEVGTLAAAFDRMVDRLQEQVQQVSESEARMKRFLADASHELRTPVTGILGHLEVVRFGAAGNPDTLDRSLTSMHTMAVRMARLVHDLLALSRLEQGEVPVRAEPVDVAGLLAEAVRTAEPATSGHVVHVEAPAAALAATGDREAMERILVNLVDNAAKYSPPGSVIRLSARAAGAGDVEILVCDQGPGVPPGERERIFERLYRGDRSRTHRPNGGSGLGLAICRALARGQGGDVTLMQADSRGSTFVVRLPGARASE